MRRIATLAFCLVIALLANSASASQPEINSDGRVVLTLDNGNRIALPAQSTLTMRGEGWESQISLIAGLAFLEGAEIVPALSIDPVKFNFSGPHGHGSITAAVYF